MNTEEERLKALRDRMSQSQRQQMAEIIQNEMKRRGMKTDSPESTVKKPSASLSRDQVGELYRDISDAVKTLRTKKVDARLAEVRSAKDGKRHALPQMKMPQVKMPQMRIPRAAAVTSEEAADYGVPPSRAGSVQKLVLMGAVVVLGIAKVSLSTNAVTIGDTTPADAAISASADREEAPVQVATNSRPVERSAELVKLDFSSGSIGPSERKLLLELDGRRVQLEQKREALDRRELDIRNQSQVLSERLAELRSLTAKLSEAKQEKDHQYQTRLEQLANVYGAMSPEEAAALISRLEDDTAIELLQRMPEKRMGQILSFMDKERAVDLTKILTGPNA